MLISRLSIASWCFALLHTAIAFPNDFLGIRESSGQQAPNLSGLARQLSPKATVTYNVTSIPRWSDYGAPQPGAVVNVATEKDVQTTVQYCLKNKIPFLAQSGTHGWQSKFNLDRNGIIINMRGLNSVTFNADRTRATVQGGVLVKEAIDAAYSNNAQLLTGNCNQVGVLGAGLGGGYGNLMGLYGFSVDQYLSLNAVLADGSAVVVTEKSNSDLWWALRGAGPNFAIVTSAVMKSYPVRKEQNMAWTGSLLFTEDKLEAIVQAIQDLHLGPKMVIFLLFVTSGPPSFTPVVATSIFYYGTEQQGRAAFKSILDIGPFQDNTKYLPYNEWNTGNDGFGTKGGLKPSYGVGHDVMDPKAWRGVWQEYTKFIQNPNSGFSAVLAEVYSHDFDQYSTASPSAFGIRNVRVNTVIIPWYYDQSLEPKATAFGSRARDLLRATDGLPRNRTYINFAFGDEPNEVVYGNSVARLRSIKKKYDPKNIFNHWFPITI